MRQDELKQKIILKAKTKSRTQTNQIMAIYDLKYLWFH